MLARRNARSQKRRLFLSFKSICEVCQTGKKGTSLPPPAASPWQRSTWSMLMNPGIVPVYLQLLFVGLVRFGGASLPITLKRIKLQSVSTAQGRHKAPQTAPCAERSVVWKNRKSGQEGTRLLISKLLWTRRGSIDWFWPIFRRSKMEDASYNGRFWEHFRVEIFKIWGSCGE